MNKDLERPIYHNLNTTYRSLCGESPENQIILTEISAIEPLTDVVRDIYNDTESGVCIPDAIEKHLVEITGIIGGNLECLHTLLDGDYPAITDECELKKLMSDVLIRFDTNPINYTKKDYQALLKLILSFYHFIDFPFDEFEKKIDAKLDTKVDKEDGKSLMSDGEHLKLEDIEAGAEVNVLSDWKEADVSADSFINNKPTKLSDFEDDLGNNPAHTHDQYLTEHLDISGKLDVLSPGTNIFIDGNVLNVPDMRYDDSEVKGMISDLLDELGDQSDRIHTVEDNILSITDRVSGDEDRISALEERADNIETELSNIDDITILPIVPTTTNFKEGELYTIHTAIERTANLFEGILQDITLNVKSLFPAQVSSTNQLADKSFVNETVAQNAANFRGNWENWNSVPTDESLYTKDYAGNRTPTNNDYLVVTDASGYIGADLSNVEFGNVEGTYGISFRYRVDGGSFTTISTSTAIGEWEFFNGNFTIKHKETSPFVKTIISNVACRYNGIEYESGSEIVVIQFADSKLYEVLAAKEQGTLDGSWRFLYTGDWATLGKSGWKPAYRIGSAFTDAQQAAIDSTITKDKVDTYDGYKARIGANETNKVDKINTANKIYGTDAQGFQIGYEAGDNITIANGKISAVDTVYDDSELRTKIQEIELFKYPNVTIIGDLSLDHGQLNNFSKTNYAILPFLFDTTGKSFEVNIAFITGSDITTAQNIIGSKYCMALFILNGSLNVRISNNGTSWDIWQETFNNINISPLTPYYIKLIYNSKLLSYQLFLSTDGKEYGYPIGTRTAVLFPHPGLIYLGIGNNFNNPFLGKINLNKCEILFNGEHFWEGMDAAGLSTRLAVDLSNIDEAGIERLKELTVSSIDLITYEEALNILSNSGI